MEEWRKQTAEYLQLLAAKILTDERIQAVNVNEDYGIDTEYFNGPVPSSMEYNGTRAITIQINGGVANYEMSPAGVRRR